MAGINGELEKQLWANTGLRPSEYTAPVLGLIFLKLPDFRFTQTQAKIQKGPTGKRTIGKADYQQMSVLNMSDST
ncbi:MAG: hypothetical protein WAK60_11645 [Sedimentisphaerales bacterium]